MCRDDLANTKRWVGYTQKITTTTQQSPISWSRSDICTAKIPLHYTLAHRGQREEAADSPLDIATQRRFVWARVYEVYWDTRTRRPPPPPHVAGQFNVGTNELFCQTDRNIAAERDRVSTPCLHWHSQLWQQTHRDHAFRVAVLSAHKTTPTPKTHEFQCPQNARFVRCGPNVQREDN